MVKRIGYLYEKVYDKNNLLEAHYKARKDKGHYPEVRRVDANLEKCIDEIHDMLKSGSYTFRSEEYRTKKIVDKGKERVLHIAPYYPHRIIQWAIILVIGDELKKRFIPTTYASVEGKGQLKASLDLRKALKHNSHYLQMDVRKFYPSIDRGIAKGQLRRLLKDDKLLRLLDTIIDSSPGESGLPLGSLLSQWLGNWYLTPLDRYIKQNLRVKHYYRYCDDLVILGNSREELNRYLDKVLYYTRRNLKLDIKPSYRLREIDQGIDFVGYVHYKNKTLLRRRNKYAIRSLYHKLNNKTKHDDLTPMDISRLSAYIGWVKHCDCDGLRTKYIDPILERWESMYYTNRVVQSDSKPKELDITPTAVYVRSDIKKRKRTDDEKEYVYYEYKESKYNKDEYIEILTKTNNDLGQEFAKEKIFGMQKDATMLGIGQELAKVKLDVMLLKGGE